MTTPSPTPAPMLPCPWCQTAPRVYGMYANCNNGDCPVYGICVPLGRWNTRVRPAAPELAKQLAILNGRNSTAPEQSAQAKAADADGLMIADQIVSKITDEYGDEAWIGSNYSAGQDLRVEIANAIDNLCTQLAAMEAERDALKVQIAPAAEQPQVEEKAERPTTALIDAVRNLIPILRAFNSYNPGDWIHHLSILEGELRKIDDGLFSQLPLVEAEHPAVVSNEMVERGLAAWSEWSGGCPLAAVHKDLVIHILRGALLAGSGGDQ